MITHTLPIAADITITYNTVYIHTPDTSVNKFGKLLFCSSSVVHIYHIACQYIGQHLYEIKWTVLLTFLPYQHRSEFATNDNEDFLINYELEKEKLFVTVNPQ